MKFPLNPFKRAPSARSVKQSAKRASVRAQLPSSRLKQNAMQPAAKTHPRCCGHATAERCRRRNDRGQRQRSHGKRRRRDAAPRVAQRPGARPTVLRVAVVPVQQLLPVLSRPCRLQNA